MIVEVAINVPIRKCFDYCWPEEFEQIPEAGLQVLVPFGRQKKGGVVVGVNKKSKLSEYTDNHKNAFDSHIIYH